MAAGIIRATGEVARLKGNVEVRAGARQLWQAIRSGEEQRETWLQADGSPTWRLMHKASTAFGKDAETVGGPADAIASLIAGFDEAVR